MQEGLHKTGDGRTFFHIHLSYEPISSLAELFFNAHANDTINYDEVNYRYTGFAIPVAYPQHEQVNESPEYFQAENHYVVEI